MKKLLIIPIVFLIVGCNYSEDVSQRGYTANVRVLEGGYIMYEIEDGEVTCLEHTDRSELSCWNNTKP